MTESEEALLLSKQFNRIRACNHKFKETLSIQGVKVPIGKCSLCDATAWSDIVTPYMEVIVRLEDKLLQATGIMDVHQLSDFIGWCDRKYG